MIQNNKNQNRLDNQPMELDQLAALRTCGNAKKKREIFEKQL